LNNETLVKNLKKLVAKSNSLQSFEDFLIECSIETVQKQPDLVMCGLFSIAFAYDLCQDADPIFKKYDSSKMRQHLLKCLEQNYFEEFPQLSKFENVYRVDSQIIFIELNEIK
jgi:hypothetical protein